MADKAPKHFLRAWREARGLSLEAVAVQAETTHATLSRVERGLIPYNQHLLERLAAVYLVSTGDLLEADPGSAEVRAALLADLDEDGIAELKRYADFVRAKKSG